MDITWALIKISNILKMWVEAQLPEPRFLHFPAIPIEFLNLRVQYREQ